MDTYPCPNCGGVADEVKGCHRCGRAHDPVAAQLHKLRQAMAGLDDESRRLDADRHAVDQQRERLLAQRQALTVAIAQRLADERAGSATKPAKGRGTKAGRTATIPVQGTKGTQGTRPTRPAPTVTAPRPAPAGRTGPLVETSARSAQNTQLTLGGILLAIAAIVIAGVYYTTTASGGRAAVLGIATTVFLGVPVLLTRNTLTATAETIASIGLLLVLLDGYTAYKANLAGIGTMPPALYASVLFALVTGVAAAYRFATHLRAPQFAALLTVQPLLPLLAVNFHFGPVGFAAIFAIVAAFNLAAVVVFGLELRILAAGRLRPRPRQSTEDGPTGLGWPRMLRELGWLMYALTLATAVVLAGNGLLRAHTVAEAVPAALATVLAAAVGMAGGLVQSEDRLRTIAGGAATLAVIAAVSRVNFLALPNYTLVLTAAVACGVAIAANLLPAQARSGPQLGALVGAGFAAVVVVISAIRTTVAVVAAETNPKVWTADLGRYADLTSTTSWQAPLAAVLLTAFAVLVVPENWRINALVLGGAVILLAAPGTGTLAWWAPALLAVAVATMATTASLYSRHGRDALIRSGTAGLLGVYAISTSLARPGLTAAVCTILALTAAATVLLVAGWPERFGPFRDRVADSAFGAAAFTLPIAVGTFAWLTQAPAGVILPMTMVTTALGVMGAAVSQTAAKNPRTASAGGALAAAVGGLVFSFVLVGADPVDTGVAVLVLAAALATASSRAFEMTPNEAGQDGMVAADSLEQPIPESADSPVVPARRKVDRSTISAGLATAALIVALARLLAVAVPGIGLVTTEAMVLLTAIAVRLMPEAWRRGPRLGGIAVGGGLGLVLAAVAVVEAGHAVAASLPFWSADLAHWTTKVAGWTPYGWQVPIGLLLAAGAIWALLPPPFGEDLGFVTFCVAALALPATFGLLWWSAVIIAGALAITAGLGAAFVPAGPEGAAPAGRRLALALVLGTYGVLVAGATSTAIALLLSAYVVAGALVAAIAQHRGVAALVPGTAAAVAMAAAPGAAATIAAASGVGAGGILTAALLVSAVGIPIAWVIRAGGIAWGGVPAFGVGAATVITAIVAASTLPSFRDAQVWAAASALVAVAAAAANAIPVRPPIQPALWAGEGLELAPTAQSTVDGETPPPVRAIRLAALTIAVTAVPSVIIAAAASAPAWLAALAGPYRTLRDVWQGYGEAPVPNRAGSAIITLLLLAGVGAIAALTLGGYRYVLAAVLPPLAAMAVLTPAAAGAPAGATSWVALGVAVVTGLGAALSPPTLPAAASLLRGTAGIVCAVTGGAGFAGALATRSGTLIALAILAAAAGIAAAIGKDPSARMVAWFIAAAAAFAFPVTVLAAADGQLRTGAFYVLAICGLLSAIAWQLARDPERRGEAAVVELTVALGATFALLITLGSPRYAAAVLTIWGLLLGVATLRRDRPAQLRRWLVRAALVAELFACWLLLYSVEVGLPEAYTLPFAAVALLVGALELRHNEELSSWLAYGPALIGGFGPSVVLVLVGDDAVWRWVTLFAAAIITVIVGSSRGRSAPVITGSAVTVVVALVEMIRLLAKGQIAGALLVAAAGGVLVVFGARSERRRAEKRNNPTGAVEGG